LALRFPVHVKLIRPKPGSVENIKTRDVMGSEIKEKERKKSEREKQRQKQRKSEKERKNEREREKQR
jgi:hypothetical protein